MVTTFAIEINQLQRLLPRFLLLDEMSTIISAGLETIESCSLKLSGSFYDSFTMTTSRFNDIRDLPTTESFQFVCKNTGQHLEGTIEKLSPQNHLLIVCHPQNKHKNPASPSRHDFQLKAPSETQNHAELYYSDDQLPIIKMIENSDVAMLTINNDGVITWINGACKILLGDVNHSIIGEDFSSLWDGNDKNFLRQFQHHIANFSSFEIELYKALNPAIPQWIYLKAQPRIEHDICVGYFVILEDISSRKQIELHGYKNAKRLRDLVTNLNDGVLLENENRQIEIINKRFCDLFSIPYSPEMLVGADCSQAADNFKHLFADEEEFVRRIEFILSEKKQVVGDKLLLKDGRWFEREFIPTITEQQYLGHLWIYSDITERTMYQHRISEQRSFYENVLNQIPSDIAVFDKSHKYLFVNPIGIKNPEIRQWIIGKTDYDYCEFRNKPRSIADDRHLLFESVIQSKELKVWEEELKRDDNSVEYYLRYMYPVFDQNNEVSMVIGYGVNITERKIAEKAIAEALAQQKELYVLKSNFVSMISHEFRTPLSTVLSSTQLLSKYSNTLTDEKKSKHLITIEKAVHRMTSLLENVLFIGRNDSNKLTFSPVTIDIAVFINELIEDFILANSGVNRIVATFEIKSPTLFADRGLLRLIISNLLTNAYKYSSPEYEVALSVYVDDKKGVFIVKDKGIGIPNEDQNHLFDEFHRASNVGNIQGTGLGLSIVKRCVDAHSGKIDVHSEVGKGTVFTITIPQDTE